MKVHKKYLLLIAGFVWFIAGFNILRIGIIAGSSCLVWWMFPLSALVLLLFHNLVFRKLVKKHTSRILSYAEIYQPFYRFFNKQAYLIMTFMMTAGIALRLSNLVPDLFIATFYSGLGISLLIAGISFVLQFTRCLRQAPK